MNSRLPILAALGAGILAAMLTSVYVDDVRRAASPNATRVMVAARDLKAGGILEASDVTEGARYVAGLPKFAIKWSDRNVYIGQPLRFAVTEDDYVLASYFGAESATADRLSEKVDAEAGQRAVTISVTHEMSLEGSIRPGDRIDVLLTYQEGSSVVTSPLLENVYVVSTGPYGSRPGSPYSALTLLAGPDEAKLLVWARNLGEISVLLRHPNDLEPTGRSVLSGDAQALKELGGGRVSLDQIRRSSGTGTP